MKPDPPPEVVTSTLVVATPSGDGLASLLGSSDLLDRVRDLLEAALAPNTRRVYAARWRAWEAFCGSLGVPAVPGRPEALVAFLTASVTAGRSISWINQARAAIRLAHEHVQQPSPTDHPVVRAAIRGARRLHGQPAQGKAPVALAMLRRVVEAIPRTGLLALRDRALILLGWWSACRRSELVGVHVEHLTESDEGLVLLVPRSKTDTQGRGADVAIPRATTRALCACEAVRAWREASAIEKGPLFRAVHGPRVGTEPLTAEMIAKVVQRRAARVGVDPRSLGAHSLRAGFATEAAIQGRPLDGIRDHLRHGSVATTLRYVRRSRRLKDAIGRGLA